MSLWALLASCPTINCWYWPWTRGRGHHSAGAVAGKSNPRASRPGGTKPLPWRCAPCRRCESQGSPPPARWGWPRVWEGGKINYLVFCKIELKVLNRNMHKITSTTVQYIAQCKSNIIFLIELDFIFNVPNGLKWKV